MVLHRLKADTVPDRWLLDAVLAALPPEDRAAVRLGADVHLLMQRTRADEPGRLVPCTVVVVVGGQQHDLLRRTISSSQTAIAAMGLGWSYELRDECGQLEECWP